MGAMASIREVSSSLPSPYPSSSSSNLHASAACQSQGQSPGDVAVKGECQRLSALMARQNDPSSFPFAPPPGFLVFLRAPRYRQHLPECVGVCEQRLVIGYKMGGTTHFYSLFSARKYVGASDSLRLLPISLLNPLPNSTAPPIKNSICQVMKEVSLLYCLWMTSSLRLENLNTLCRTQPMHVCASLLSFMFSYSWRL